MCIPEDGHLEEAGERTVEGAGHREIVAS